MYLLLFTLHAHSRSLSIKLNEMLYYGSAVTQENRYVLQDYVQSYKITYIAYMIIFSPTRELICPTGLCSVL